MNKTHNFIAFIFMAGLIGNISTTPKKSGKKFDLFQKHQTCVTRLKNLKIVVTNHLPNSGIKKNLITEILTIERDLGNLKLVMPIILIGNKHTAETFLQALELVRKKIELLEKTVTNIFKAIHPRPLLPQFNLQSIEQTKQKHLSSKTLKLASFKCKNENNDENECKCECDKNEKSWTEITTKAIFGETATDVYKKISSNMKEPYIDEDDKIQWAEDDEIDKKWKYLSPKELPTKKTFELEAIYWQESHERLLDKEEQIQKTGMKELRAIQGDKLNENSKFKEKLELCKNAKQLKINLETTKAQYHETVNKNDADIKNLQAIIEAIKADIEKINSVIEEKGAIKTQNAHLETEINELKKAIHKLEENIACQKD